MNWLAHALLSGPDTEFRLGNLLADLVKGVDREGMSPAFRHGTRVHQSIDGFTDRHPLVARSRARIGNGYRRVSGVLVDIFHDHFLALSWHDHAPQQLAAFTAAVYADLHAFAPELPARVRAATTRMMEEDWLGSCVRLDGVAATLRRVNGILKSRTGRDLHLEQSMAELCSNFEGLREDFDAFFPRLREHAFSSDVMAFQVSPGQAPA